MHYRGSHVRLRGRAYPDGRAEMLLSVPRYHFTGKSLQPAHAQTGPRQDRNPDQGCFRQFPIEPHESRSSKEVRYGPQSSDEMFIGLFAVYGASSSAANLTASVGARAVWSRPNGAFSTRELDGRQTFARCGPLYGPRPNPFGQRVS